MWLAISSVSASTVKIGWTTFFISSFLKHHTMHFSFPFYYHHFYFIYLTIFYLQLLVSTYRCLGAESDATPMHKQWSHVFSCDQAALRILQSVRLSVCYTFSQYSCHCIITKFSGVITIDTSDAHAKDHGQRATVKVTQVKTQLNPFRTVTPVWLHIWWWNDVKSLMLLRRDALLFFKVIHQTSRSHDYKRLFFLPK